MSARIIKLAAVASLLLALATFTVTLPPKEGLLVWSDGIAYFLYARSAVVDFDTDLTREYDDFVARLPADTQMTRSHLEYVRRNPSTGRVSVPWPPGSGAVMTPFYALGYMVELVRAALTGQPADSYGLIPQYFFCLGSLVYAVLGFWLTVRLCRRVASGWIPGVASLALVLGGPLVFYIFFHPSMAHASSFGLTALFTLLWWRYWDGEMHELLGIAVLGLLVGVMVTVRYQNLVFGLMLVALVLREVYRRSIPGAARIAAVGLIASLIPLSLSALHYRAMHQGETDDAVWQVGGLLHAEQNTLDLTSPNFFNALFSCQHGAFYWAPLLGLGFVGLVWAGRRQGWARVFLVTFLAHVFVIGALDTWSGDASLGMRYLAECAPILAVGLAVLMDVSSRRVGPAVWAGVLGVLIVSNGMLIIAYGLGTISRVECVTYSEMADGIVEALKLMLGG